MDKKIYIYNTLTKQKEELKTIKENVCSMYSCGPTVYDFAHIGNFRYFLFVDLLRRVLKYNNIKLNHIMNITDVGHLVSDADTGEDKMIKASKRENKSPYDIARFYEKVFLEDMEKLNISKPERIERVTDYIKEMEEYVLKIMDNGFAYTTEDTVYFDTSKLEKYGVLSKVNTENQMAGARVDFDSKKKNITDFALWIKAPKEHIMRWDSFFGESYPGWHLECSALSNIFLGNHFDIHTGGEDHIHIHHENEIAQSMGHSNCNPANYWIHSGFLQIDSGKMSKSLGNTYTISNLEEKGYDALDFKFFTFTANYRNKLNFTFDALNASKTALEKLRVEYFEHKNSKNDSLTKEKEELVNSLREEFETLVRNDLNITAGISKVWELVKIKEKSTKIAAILTKLDEVLGIELNDENRYKKALENLNKETESLTFEDLNEKQKELVIKRKEARENKDYNLSDKLRDELLENGIIVKDTKDGMTFLNV